MVYLLFYLVRTAKAYILYEKSLPVKDREALIYISSCTFPRQALSPYAFRHLLSSAVNTQAIYHVFPDLSRCFYCSEYYIFQPARAVHNRFNHQNKQQRADKYHSSVDGVIDNRAPIRRD